MESAPVEVTLVTPLRSGLAEIKAWALTPNSELVAHPVVSYPDEPPSRRWAVSHRRTGQAVDQYQDIYSREDALSLAQRLERLGGWEKLSRDGAEIKGMTEAEMRDLYALVKTTVAAFRDEVLMSEDR